MRKILDKSVMLPMEAAVWAAEFVRARGQRVPNEHVEATLPAIMAAHAMADAAVFDLRETIGVTFEPRDESDEMVAFMSIDEFCAGVKVTAFTDDDGFGELATSAWISNVRVYPSYFPRGDRWMGLPRWATHVAWYNK